MRTIPDDLRTFAIMLNDTPRALALVYTWPAIERACSWIGLPWYKWDSADHRQLAAIVAAGLLHVEPEAKPDTVAARMIPSSWSEYRQMADDAFTYAHTGKTRAERVEEMKAEAEAAKKAGDASGEDQASQ